MWLFVDSHKVDLFYYTSLINKSIMQCFDDLFGNLFISFGPCISTMVACSLRFVALLRQ